MELHVIHEGRINNEIQQHSVGRNGNASCYKVVLIIDLLSLFMHHAKRENESDATLCRKNGDLCGGRPACCKCRRTVKSRKLCLKSSSSLMMVGTRW